MRELALFGCAVAVMACDPIPPSGDIFAPRPVAAVAQAAPVAPAAADTEAVDAPVDDGSFDFDSEDRKDDEASGEAVDPLQLQARLFGADPSALPAPAPAPAPAPETAPAAAAPVMGMAPPVWNAGQPLEGSWGIRLVAVVSNVQPPRAVIALSDGTEVVVQPGDMLPEHRIVVMAVGANAVQLAHVNPEGFYASVRTETIASLYDATPSAAGTP